MNETNQIIKINYNTENDTPTVLGRDLHEALEIKTRYADWFSRMCEYGFAENIDYTCFSNLSSENQHGGQNKIDHQLTIEMAKEICMIQRSEKGKEFRKYFIEVEKAWNNPEMVMARALKLANNKINLLEIRIDKLETENKLFVSDTLTWADRPLINAIIRRYASYACSGNFGFAWIEFKKELLYKYGNNINSRIISYLNEYGKKPKTLDMIDDDELINDLKTTVSMCENKAVDISDLLNKRKNVA